MIYCNTIHIEIYCNTFLFVTEHIQNDIQTTETKRTYRVMVSVMGIGCVMVKSIAEGKETLDGKKSRH